MIIPLIIVGVSGVATWLITATSDSDNSTMQATGNAAGAYGSDPAKNAAQKQKDIADANEATAAFAGIVTLVGTAISVSSPPATPFVAGAGAVVGAAWSKLSVTDRAKIWRGELK